MTGDADDHREEGCESPETHISGGQPRLFRSFFQGGFECSTHRRRSGQRRLDLVAATHHDRTALADYRALAKHGIRTVRDGLRWHLIETSPGRYDWSSFLPMLRAARDTGTQVIWDLCHYGWPDGLDIWTPAFVSRFAAFARAAAEVVRHEQDSAPFFSLVNEPSFWSWAGGEVPYINPFAKGRGFELKVQLVRAVIEAAEAVWSVDRRTRIVHADPVIHIVADPARRWGRRAVEGHRLAQYQAWDLLSGRLWPQIGGDPKYLDIIGVNYYSRNQWIYKGATIDVGHPQYRPFREILREVNARYERPLFIAETGAEGERRPAWLRYIGTEVRAAIQEGVPLKGICLYPIVNHPGWDDERHCPNGLFGYLDEDGGRPVYEPLATELHRQQQLFNEMERPEPETNEHAVVRA